MEIENIKDLLEIMANDNEPDGTTRICKEALTLINELESENERLLDQRNRTFNIWVKDTEKLKDRIAELEKGKTCVWEEWTDGDHSIWC